jgi:hypothetical protein
LFHHSRSLFSSLFVSGIKNSPRYHRLYECWASLELREENVVAAKRLIAKALTLNKHNGPGWLIAASIEQRLGNGGLVGLILRRGIECAPTDAELYRSLGEHLVQKGDIGNVSCRDLHLSQFGLSFLQTNLDFVLL